ncbi:DUF5677 domain-containing protein [Comamonas sp. UBA7528]|uniref:DUF5677 domain-containing protein n=1 Tax=Comamonas sp. UBA7528 TaxID=1946391 RepID=UPI0025C2260A|nr:DUF5677 domain-containing protein [Comamonas sp. UBA7528]
MKNIKFPAFGMDSRTESTFAKHSFLSEELMQMRYRNEENGQEIIDIARKLIRYSLNDLEILNKETFAPKEWTAMSFFFRMLESSQASILLADMGMNGAATTTLRTGYECLFFACACWRKPEFKEKLPDGTRNEMYKITNGLSRFFNDSDFSEEIANKISKLNVKPLKSGPTYYEAAQVADLEILFQGIYRSLSMLGAHATEHSLINYKPSGENMTVNIGPSFENFEKIFEMSVLCIQTGRERLREHFSHIQFD